MSHTRKKIFHQAKEIWRQEIQGNSLVIVEQNFCYISHHPSACLPPLQHKFMILWFWRSEVLKSLTGHKSMCRQSCVPSGGFRGESISLPFPHCFLSSDSPAFLFSFSFFSFLAMPCSMWDLSSLTSDRTGAPCSGSVES